jgi:membrane-associated phospholipid phosphatase
VGTPPHTAELPAAVRDGDARRAIALIVGVGATVAFVLVRLVVALGGHRPLDVDVWWHGVLRAGQSDILIVLAWIPAVVGGTIGMIVIGLVVVILFLVRRRRWDAATLATAMVVVVAIGAPMAAVIARVRPQDSLAESVPTSFPSGHTAVATTVVVILGLLLRRWYVWTLGAVWVVVMMWSRTYLLAHWLSDVVAGMLEGIAVACFVWCFVEALRDRRAQRRALVEATGPRAEGQEMP